MDSLFLLVILHFNMYTGPAYLSALLDIINLILIVTLFRDYRIEYKTRITTSKQHNEKESQLMIWLMAVIHCCASYKARDSVDAVAVGIILVIIFVVYGTFGVYET